MYKIKGIPRHSFQIQNFSCASHLFNFRKLRGNMRKKCLKKKVSRKTIQLTMCQERYIKPIIEKGGKLNARLFREACSTAFSETYSQV